MAEKFIPKEEFRIKFDENIRQKMDDIDTTLTYRAIDWKEPEIDPQSMYCAV